LLQAATEQSRTPEAKARQSIAARTPEKLERLAAMSRSPARLGRNLSERHREAISAGLVRRAIGGKYPQMKQEPKKPRAGEEK
jgi:hypothetical protein